MLFEAIVQRKWRRVSCAVLVVLLQELVPITNCPDYITTLRTRFRSSLQPHAYRHVLEDFRQSSTERSTPLEN